MKIAVNGATIDHDTGSLISLGIFTISSTPSLKTKVDGNGIYTTPLEYSFSGGSASGFVSGTVRTQVTQTIAATATKTKDSDILVMREDDSGTMICIGDLPSGGTGPVSGAVKISDAGQTKVDAE